jgi:hypothetical protein
MAPHPAASQHGVAPHQGSGSVLPRDMSGMQGTDRAGPNSTPEVGGAPRLAAAKVDVQDTFTALDEENRATTPVWIHNGGNVAEAGFKDPTLGWVGVRAQADASGIHAAVVPGSLDASQALGGSLANLGNFLAEHHTSVQTLTMAAPENSWDGKHANPQGGFEAGTGNPQHGQSGQQHETTNGDFSLSNSPGPNLSEARPADASSPINTSAGGTYISVIA